MAMSGITVADDLIETFNKMKSRKLSPKVKWMRAKINDNQTEVILDFMYTEEDIAKDFKDHKEKSPQELNEMIFENLKDKLVPEEPFFYIFDFHTVNAEGSVKDKIILLSWCSDDAHIKKRMVFASTRSLMEDKCKPDHKFQCNEKADICFKEIDALVKKI